jgi:hypothetical protein
MAAAFGGPSAAASTTAAISKGTLPKPSAIASICGIPPAAHTYQSDVETVHRLEEDEFFDLEDFTSRNAKRELCALNPSRVHFPIRTPSRFSVEPL